MNSENTYSNPDELVRNNLKHLIGKNITLYTAAGGQSARGFSGILVSVHDDFVKLVNKKRIKHVLYPNPRNPIRKFLFRLNMAAHKSPSYRNKKNQYRSKNR